MSLHFFYLTNQRMCIPTFGLKGYLREKGLAISCGTVDRLNLLYHINCWDLSQGVLWAETNPWRLQLKPSGFHLDISPTPKNTSKYTWARGVEFTLLGGSASIYSLTDLCTVKTPKHLSWVSKESASPLPRRFWSLYWDRLFSSETIYVNY